MNYTPGTEPEVMHTFTFHYTTTLSNINSKPVNHKKDWITSASSLEIAFERFRELYGIGIHITKITTYQEVVIFEE